ncbi:CDP-diacylglycerol--serine O-phosphatidyltransferase [Thermithiobacillus plumbiphilus]|uniref:CDP-diacylglycerol--serine O-phosphatidyltransferase n=1 Tax=Thermithiobacillus plumbiphilus TaxID=1729899 RepID=A0ABU9D7Y5_9PROT
MENTPRRGVYVLPNLFTTASLFAGFYAIIKAIGGDFQLAASVIFIAMVLDGLDGRIARLTNTQSDFGAEYDSLADVIAFGLAPSVVLYLWGLSGYGKIGWLGAFVFTACGALRLARFNTQVHVASKSHFQGLPIPAAAATLAGLVWVAESPEVSGFIDDFAQPIALALVYLLGLFMVSNFRYKSFKDVDLRGRVPFVLAVIGVLIVALIAVHPPLVLFAASLTYALSGPVLTLLQMRQRKEQRR